MAADILGNRKVAISHKGFDRHEIWHCVTRVELSVPR